MREPIRSATGVFALIDAKENILWYSSGDTNVLDPRTAAVLALGEACLTELKSGEGGLMDRMGAVLYHHEVTWKAALAADADAAK